MGPALTSALATHSCAVFNELDTLSNRLDVTRDTLGESQSLLGSRDAKIVLGRADGTVESIVEVVQDGSDTSRVLDRLDRGTNVGDERTTVSGGGRSHTGQGGDKDDSREAHV